MKRFLQLSPNRLSDLLLHIELPLILLQAVVFLVAYLVAREESPGRAFLMFSPLLSYLLTPMLLSFFSALLIRRLGK